MTVLARETRATTCVPFAGDLASHGDRTALITADGSLSYRELAMRVQSMADRLGTRRRLVMLAGANRVDVIVTYLAALAGGHPLLLAPSDNPTGFAALLAAYDPDTVVTSTDDQWEVRDRRDGSAHDLHPDLALLLGTSGSTGSPKLVRLSHDNVQSNAEAIADYLDIRDTDRAVTSLPMHYCYGLSVINSHLLRGAAIILTELSVADSCFWELARKHRASTLAGVPYTFDLLDRVGFAGMSLPSLRYITQAGGRLAPERVRDYAAIGRRDGWDLVVMYGQTEATARMAYLPPDLATDNPQAIGVPIPGGSFRLAPLDADGADDPDTGELVYSGPNVMLGYAQTPADLNLGRTITELHTGDIARRGHNGLYQIVGRRSRFLKLFGLRLDLEQIEALLRRRGVAAWCTGTDDELIVAVEEGDDPGRVQRIIADEYGLPGRVIRVHALAELPRLASGKPDYAAIRALAPQPEAAPAGDLRSLFAEVLGSREVTEDSTFVNLGGDSLSYVVMSIRLEQRLGQLPPSWHTRTIGDLSAMAQRQDDQAQASGARRMPLRRARRLDTTVALRAIAIVLIVGSHIQVFDLPGGAHVLIGVAGFNFARFQLTTAVRTERVRHLARSVSRIVLASVSWIAAMYLLTDDYDLASVFLAGTFAAPDDQVNYWWHFWFVEALVYFLLILLAAVSLPLFDRLERRFPFGVPLTLAAIALIPRYQLVPGLHMPTPVVVFWLFALGWAAGKASTVAQRICVTVAIIATVPTLFGTPGREGVIIGGLVLMVWVADLPSLRLVNRVAAVFATSSLYIYLTHWQIFRPIDDTSRPLALFASLAFGVAYAMLVPRVSAWVVASCRRRSSDGVRPGSPASSEPVTMGDLGRAAYPLSKSTQLTG